jgi:hypothetical protein
VFRFLPPLIILVLLTASFHRYYQKGFLFAAIISTLLISLIPNIEAFEKADSLRIKLTHLSVAIIAIIEGLAVYVVGRIFNLSWLAPGPDVVDDFWSALLMGSLVAVFFAAIRREPTQPQYDRRNELAKQSFIIESYVKFKKKYGSIIATEAEKNNSFVPVIYAIIIYEDYNRPALIRLFEDLCVNIFHREMTVGIAQIRSNRTLSGEESIKRLANYFSETGKLGFDEFCNDIDIQKQVNDWNPGMDYWAEIKYIMDILKPHNMPSELIDTPNADKAPIIEEAETADEEELNAESYSE